MKSDSLMGLVAAALVGATVAGGLWASEIHDASGAGDLEKVKTLLKDKPDLVNDREPDGGTPLHVAALLGQKAVVEVLLAAKADVGATNRLGFTPLQLARLRGHQKVVELLLANNPKAEDRLNVLRESLIEAIKSGLTEKVKAIVNDNPNLDLANAKDRFDNSALHLAAYIGNVGLMEFLLSKNAAPEARNRDGNTPLHAAAAALIGSKEAVELLLKQKVPVAVVSEAGLTPLHLACDRGNIEVVKLLIEKGADVNARTKLGITPLLVAADREQLEVAKTLLDHKAEPSPRGDKNATPLHYAVRNGDRAFVELLLAFKADLNAKTIDGVTPLALANQKGQVAVTEILKKAGAKEK